MADRLLVEIEDPTLAERAAAQAGDRRRRRRALAAAVVVHLLILMAPRPRPDAGPPVDPGDPRLFLLTDVRFAPPEPPEPVVPELDPEAEDAPPEEEIVEEAAPPGPPPPPAVEVLFPEGDLSRLTPPRPLDAAPPPAPPEAPAEGGEVHLYLQLDENGQVYGVRGASGDAALLAAAAQAAKGWVFLPATLDGQPIPVVVEVVVRFPRRAPPAAPPPPAG
jgi:periplasmic protein TonB